jgi:hypothetical protein
MMACRPNLIPSLYSGLFYTRSLKMSRDFGAPESGQIELAASRPAAEVEALV